MKLIINVLVILFLFSSCTNTSNTKTTDKAAVHKVIAQEVLHVNEYSYVRVLEDGNENWIAAPSIPVKIGTTYYYGKAMEMKNFESKELGKTFETVYFVEKISITEEDAKLPLTTNPHPTPAGTTNEMLNTKATKPTIEKKVVKIEASENTISIAELFKNQEKYNNKIVKLKGEVTKYNPAIMNVNWIHMQDGTEFNGEFDLTVTTSETVKVGDIVTIQGSVSLNKDFGAGYLYAIIIENATLVK